MMCLVLEEPYDRRAKSFRVKPIKNVKFHDRSDILLCTSDRPLVLPAPYTPSGVEEGTSFCGLADRFVEGSLLSTGHLPAMVDVLIIRKPIDINTDELTDTTALFAYTGILSIR
jgi:hypothetical protein